MAEWTAPVGTGVIKIVDTGGNVEFWVTAGNGIAYDYNMAWSGVINGVGVGGTFRYEPGMGWQRVFVTHVSYNQNVSFTKTQNSGSTGLGGPNTVNAYISRSGPPPAPIHLGVDQITQTSVRYMFQSTGDGGSPVLEWEVGWGPTSAGATNWSSSDGTETITGLSPDKVYYIWSHGRNANGWGPWTPGYQSVRTAAGARIKVAGVWKNAIPYLKVAGIWKLVQPYIKESGVWKSTL